MQEKLSIKSFRHENDLLLQISGRIDAFRASQLTDHLENEIQEGNFRIRLELTEVQYISSAGIRVLLQFYKKLMGLNGYLMIAKASENVMSVLNMVGMQQLLTQPDKIKTETAPETISWGEGSIAATEKALDTDLPMLLRATGTPGINRADSANIFTGNLNKNIYGLGLGAFGDSFEDIKSRIGEIALFGNAAAYLPSNGRFTPDYSVRTGNYIPSFHMSYGILAEGTFNRWLHYERKGAEEIPFSRLIHSILNHYQYDSIYLQMIAETSGVVGMSVICNTSSSETDKFLSFPELRDQVHFTTEPEYQNHIVLVTGFVTRKNDSTFASFLRPLDGTLNGHFHAAVFSFMPVIKHYREPEVMVGELFDHARLVDLLHMLNDDREETGAGESTFLQGNCWFAPINQ